MIMADSKYTKPSTWLLGNKPEVFAVAPSTTRALEIAKYHQELVGLLKDRTESEYELSLTDLVEKQLTVNDTTQAVKALPDGGVKQTSILKDGKRKRRNRRSMSGSSDRVLLNMYIPTSLTRSFTSSSSSRGLSHQEKTSSSMRDKDQVTFGCLSAIWKRRHYKPRQQE